MVEGIFLEGLATSLLIGALLGLEREYSKKQEVVGLRTFALISLFGYLAVVISGVVNNNALVFIGFVFVAIFSVLLYTTSLTRTEKIGFTTSISVMLTYLLGLFVGFGWRVEAVFLGVVISIVLFSKERLHLVVEKLTQKEVGDLLEFLVLLGIIYPLLPASISIFGIAVPLLMIWGIIVLISVINFCVFIGTRYIPIQHKAELFGFLGGLINTQAIIEAMMNAYRQNKRMFQNVASGFILANTAMYLRNFILITIIAPATLFVLGLPVVLVLLTLVPFSRLFVLMKHKEARMRISSPFGVWPAAKLGLAILVVFVLLELSMGFSKDLLLLTAILGSLIYSLAVIVSLGSMVLNGSISVNQAALAFILANAASVVSNFFVLYATGGRDVAKKVDKPMIISVIVSLVGVLLSIAIFALA
jgi:uncharacterized membrane protein (DUF4010 family)